ncbi:YajQ family cyclic di-GMP-binding protein [Oleidesulfovibrio sp.]|uniref:YajQ family cyclic di-GMP-binding protein n=1 Tax=Oleidesulfovibrio sp. TaxID=2909707 RepID=UPI003A879C4E
MPSFDVVSKVDLQEVDNVVNNVKKEVDTRYDFRGSNTELNFDKGATNISIVSSDDMKMRAIQEMLLANCVRRKVDPKFLDFEKIEPTSKGMVKRVVAVRDGISKEIAQKIVKKIKASKLKVQAAIQDEQVRVTGKKIDDLQSVIQLLREDDCGVPLQFINMRS